MKEQTQRTRDGRIITVYDFTDEPPVADPQNVQWVPTVVPFKKELTNGKV